VLNRIYYGRVDVYRFFLFFTPRNPTTGSSLPPMNARPTLRPSLCALTALMVLGFGFNASAQSVATTPVGAMTYTFPANTTVSVGIPLVRPAVFTGVVSSGNTTSISFSTAGLNLATAIPVGSFYYIEVVGHSDNVTTTHVGDRFEVDETTTTVAANGVLSIDAASNLNTATGDFSSLVGYKIVIRPHWTLAALFGTGNGATGLTSSTTFSSADQVLSWDGAGWSTYWFRQNSAGTVKEWRNTATSTTNQDNTLIPPGVGVYFKKLTSTLAVSVVGEVRTNRFIRNLDHSTQLIAMGYPVDRSPSQMAMLPASNYTAATSFDAADQLLAWDGAGFSTYWLRRNSAGDIIQWRNTGTGTTDHSSTGFILSNQAFFIRPVGTPNDVVQTTPFTL
ncbi:MAG TPA: hypothetical protein VLA04_00545, partial [Verrucomicrobiae bacterium]|nr:hypothetical protein [Verrucomicrobiae bacterium]